MRTLPLLSALLGALLLSACQDPAAVGLDLIGDEGADPNVQILPALSADTLGTREAAIGFARATDARPQTRALVGNVVDPLFGDARATAFLDAEQPVIPEGTEATDVQAVWLELRRTYTYGDTTTSLPLALSQVQGLWQVTDYPADTLFATGPVLTTATATTAAEDSLVRFTLPASWVSANAETLLADDFITAFEGFAIRVADGFTPAPGAVYGFSTLSNQGSRLSVATSEDTLFFPLGEVFTSIQKTTPIAPPAVALPARAYSGAAATLRFDVGSVGPLPLARALLKVPVDQSLAQDGAFVRPLASRIQVIGVRSTDTTRTLIGELQLGADGELRTTALSQVLFTTRLQDALVQGFATEDPYYDRFELVFPASAPASLDIFPLLRPDVAVGLPPRLLLTVVGGA